MSSVPNASSFQIPAGIPPPGVNPNFTNPQTLAPTVIAFSVVMMTWTLSFVIIRLYANFHAPRGLGVDDYFCIIATILAFGYTAMQILSNRYARHSYDLPLAWLNERYEKLSYAIVMIVGPTLFFGKSTILLLYLRIFSIKRPMRYSIWLGLVFGFLLYWIGVLFGTIWCTPRAGEKWDLKGITQSCDKDITYGLVQGVLGLVLDLYIFFIPIRTILGLQTSLRRRLSILGVFGTAILGIAAAVLGLVYRVKLYTSNDQFWAVACVTICNACEIYVAIIVGSMPAFASFFKGQMPSASLLARINSFVLQIRHAVSRRRISKELHSSEDLIIPNRHEGDKGYLELHDTRHLDEDGLGSIRTDIRGEGTVPRDLEEGAVRKTITVQQSRQAPPTTQVSELSTFTTWD